MVADIENCNRQCKVKRFIASASGIRVPGLFSMSSFSYSGWCRLWIHNSSDSVVLKPIRLHNIKDTEIAIHYPGIWWGISLPTTCWGWGGGGCVKRIHGRRQMVPFHSQRVSFRQQNICTLQSYSQYCRYHKKSWLDVSQDMTRVVFSESVITSAGLRSGNIASTALSSAREDRPDWRPFQPVFVRVRSEALYVAVPVPRRYRGAWSSDSIYLGARQGGWRRPRRTSAGPAESGGVR